MKSFIVLLISCLSFTISMAQDSSRTIYFDFDQHELRASAKAALDEFIMAYKNGEIGDNIVIKGHCDITGPVAYNELLARRRTFSVHEYLLNNGIPKTSVTTIQSFGERMPVNDNSTRAERQLNRRVELIWTLPVAEPPVQVKEEEPVVPIKDFSKTAIDTVKEGDILRLRNINFYGGRHTFLPIATIPLQELLEVMQSHPKLVIEIQGHICCRPGSPIDGADFDSNDNHLSRNRAKAVYDFLAEHGIAKERMSYVGFAGTRPLIYPEQTEADRTANRRVEVKIVSK